MFTSIFSGSLSICCTAVQVTSTLWGCLKTSVYALFVGTGVRYYIFSDEGDRVKTYLFKTFASMFAGSLALASSTMPSNGSVIREKNISFSLAEEAAKEAVSTCASKGYQVTATVVDRAGDVKVIYRADGAGPHTIDASRRKAYTSASAKNGTTAMLSASQGNPAAQNLGQIDGFLLLGGGLPIRSGEAVIGAIGVGGAPGGPLDDLCAQAGIDKIADRISH